MSTDDVDNTDTADELWHESSVLIGVVGVDIFLLVGVMLGTATFVGRVIPVSMLDTLGPVTMNVAVPWEVYTFSILGAFGYVFTALIRDFDRTRSDVLRYHLRIPAAIPLGAGVYLLSDLILGTGASADGTMVSRNGTLVAGLAFLSGLYVNLAYERLSALAERLLPNEDDPGDNDQETSGE